MRVTEDTYSKMYTALGKYTSEYRRRTARHSISVLRQSKLYFELLNTDNLHLRIENKVDFWASTGHWKYLNKDIQGDNVEGLVFYLKGTLPEYLDATEIELICFS